MTTSVQSDSTRFYESTVTSGLVIQLRALLGIEVTTEHGQRTHSRTFQRADLPVWPREYGDEAEVDFFGKCQHKEVFPQLFRATYDNNAFLTTSEVARHHVPPPSNKAKKSNWRESLRYVVGEVLYGGRKALIPKKAEQLERAVRLAFIMKYETDYLMIQPRDLVYMVLGAVECAIVVHQENSATVFFQHVSAAAYPLLSIVMDAGRLVFVHNTLVPTRLIALLREEAADQREQLEAHRTIIADQESQLARQQEVLEQQGERLATQEIALAELQRQYRELLALVVGSGRSGSQLSAAQGPSGPAETGLGAVSTDPDRTQVDGPIDGLSSKKRRREREEECGPPSLTAANLARRACTE